MRYLVAATPQSVGQHFATGRQLASMSQFRSFALLLVVTACGGSSPEPAKPAPAPARTAADLVPTCQRIFARKAACADDYLPRLLDVRVELNLPPGIGDRVASEGRDAVLAVARTELARDTQPAAVATLCETAAAQARQAPPERVERLLDEAGRCAATPDCKAFATCAAAIDRGFIAASARQR
jgi:hypothetical protein